MHMVVLARNGVVLAPHPSTCLHACCQVHDLVTHWARLSYPPNLFFFLGKKRSLKESTKIKRTKDTMKKATLTQKGKAPIGKHPRLEDKNQTKTSTNHQNTEIPTKKHLKPQRKPHQTKQAPPENKPKISTKRKRQHQHPSKRAMNNQSTRKKKNRGKESKHPKWQQTHHPC